MARERPSRVPGAESQECGRAGRRGRARRGRFLCPPEGSRPGARGARRRPLPAAGPPRRGRGLLQEGGEGPRCSAAAGPARAGGSDEYSEGEGEGRGLSARRGSLQPEPHDARRRQREPPEPQKPGSGRRARGVGAARSAQRSPCAPRDASPPRQPRQARRCGRRRRRCHVPGEARGGRSGDKADRLEEEEAEAVAGGGDEGAGARAHGGARLARPGHVPGRAGHEAGGAGGAAASAFARAALGAAAAAAAVAPGPGEPPAGPGRGWGGAGGWGRDWQPLHLPGAPCLRGSGRRRGGGQRPRGPPLGGQPLTPATEPLPRLPRTRGRAAGSGVPGFPEPPGGRPREGCRPSLARPCPKLVTSGRRGPGSPARGGRRGRVC